MKLLKHMLLGTLFVLTVAVIPPTQAQTKTQEAESKTVTSPENDAQKNVQAYIDLLRRDVRQEKAEIMGSVMLLSAQDAAKFWPIYSDYDAQLTKLNDQRVENIKEYARTYDQMKGCRHENPLRVCDGGVSSSLRWPELFLGHRKTFCIDKKYLAV